MFHPAECNDETLTRNPPRMTMTATINEEPKHQPANKQQTNRQQYLTCITYGIAATGLLLVQWRRTEKETDPNIMIRARKKICHFNRERCLEIEFATIIYDLLNVINIIFRVEKLVNMACNDGRNESKCFTFT